MKDKRKKKRRHLIYYLHVQERSTDRHIGYLVDITTEGIMIMSENPIAAGTELELKILLQSDMSPQHYLYFDVRAMRCERSINATTYDIGFELLNLTPDDFNEIEMVIDEQGFRD